MFVGALPEKAGLGHEPEPGSFRKGKPYSQTLGPNGNV